MNKGQPKIVILQPIAPDYRLGFFKSLKDIYGVDLIIFAGNESFGGSPVSDPKAWSFVTRVKNRFLFKQKFLWQFGGLRETLSADLVIACGNMRILSTLFVQIIRKILGKPTVLWGHAEGKKGDLEFMRWLYLRFCDGFITYTEDQKGELSGRYPWLRLWSAPNACVSACDCLPVDAGHDDVDCFLFVGRLVAEKKADLMIRAFALACEDNLLPVYARLIILGDGEQRERLVKLGEELGVAHRLGMPGHVNDISQLRKYYGKAICSVSPGYVGLSATQSFSFGVPMLVATNEPHSPEIEACRPGFSAVFFKSDSATQLAQALGEAWTNRADFVEKRSELSKWTRDHYSFEVMRETFVRVVKEFS